MYSVSRHQQQLAGERLSGVQKSLNFFAQGRDTHHAKPTIDPT